MKRESKRVIARPDDDHYNTPREAAVPFARAMVLPDVIWEPACGEGALSTVLEEHGHTVISTTLKDRGYGETGLDFFAFKEPRAPVIVTNPPFNVIDDWVKHSLAFDPDILCIFCKSRFKEGADRYREIHSRRPFSIEFQFIQRIIFFAGDTPVEDQPGWNTEPFSWFVWIKGWHREPITRWLDRDDGYHDDLFGKNKRRK